MTIQLGRLDLVPQLNDQAIVHQVRARPVKPGRNANRPMSMTKA